MTDRRDGAKKRGRSLKKKKANKKGDREKR